MKKLSTIIANALPFAIAVVALIVLGSACGTKTVVVTVTPKPAVTVTAQPAPAPSDSATYQNGTTVDSRVSRAASMYHTAYGHENTALAYFLAQNYTASSVATSRAIASWNAAHDYYNSFATTDNDATQEKYLDAYARLVRASITSHTVAGVTRWLDEAQRAWDNYQNYVASIGTT